MARTPSAVGPTVRRFCAGVRPDRDPVFLRVAADPDCHPNACFQNVSRRVLRDGGAPQFGWSIWLWPHVFIEAEHHAVYAPPGGRPWLDITPGPRGLKRRLFLPDDAALHDPAAGQRRDNIRMALSDDPLIAELFAGAEARSEVWNGAAQPGDVQVASLNRLEAAEHAQVRAQFHLGMRYTPANAPCFCGSGKRFKRCHGRTAVSPRGAGL